MIASIDVSLVRMTPRSTSAALRAPFEAAPRLAAREP
jgi:hypothetical protein